MPKKMKYTIIGLFLALAIAAIPIVIYINNWMKDYHAGLHPEFLFSLSIQESSPLEFSGCEIALGHEVWEICKSKGIPQRSVFALKGKKAVKFVPDQFHGVHGRLETVDADSDTVYLYRYRNRYNPMLYQ